MNDLKFAFRQLLKNPGFASVAVLTLALGIGANTIVFSWIRAVLLDAVPGARDGSRLVVLCPRHVSGKLTDTTSVPDNRDLAAETNIFAGVTGSRYDAMSLRLGNEIEWIWAESTTANFFDVLGVGPALGRFFLPDEDTHPGGDSVVILSHELWQKRFGGDPRVFGRVVEIASRPFTVVGIAPANFHGGMGGLRFDLWIPITMTTEFNDTAEALNRRNWRFLHTYARLQPGVTLARAQAAASTVMRRLEQEYADTNRDTGIAVLPVWKSPWGGQSAFLPLLRSLAVVASLLLLLVAANVANLLLARATVRQQEIAVRLALGAKRVRLIRQLLTESVLLSGFGGLLGCLFAAWGVGLIFKLLPPVPHLPLGYDMHLNATVLFFSAIVTVVTGILFGLAPALQAARTNLNDTLKQAGRTGASGLHNHRLRSSLVVCEVALAVVLLVGMTLCARSLQQAHKIDRGLDPQNVWAAGFRLPPAGYDDERTRNTYHRLREKLADLPGVESVALADWLPLGLEGGSSTRFAVDGYQPASGEAMSAGVSTVSPDYFRTLRIPIPAGREFAERDDAQAARVVVINQLFADRYFSGRNPLGLKIDFWSREWTVVGVAKNGKYRSLNEPPQPFIYVCEPQISDRSLAAIVRTTGDPRGIARAVERTAVAVDPLLKPVAALTMTEYTAGAFTISRMAATLLTALGAVALILATLGIYGVMACSVNQRTREIGVRMALGAQRGDVLRVFVMQGMKLAGLGVLVGVVGTMGAAQVLSTLLIGVSASDPFTYLTVVALLVGVAFLACWLPARRAARVDPMEALRCE
jgi:predicted permease